MPRLLALLVVLGSSHIHGFGLRSPFFLRQRRLNFISNGMLHIDRQALGTVD